MDWNKTKTIFIVVFSILNVFLYSMYVNSYNESKKLDVIGQTNIDDELKVAHIKIADLPTTVENTSYISGKTKLFSAQDTVGLAANQTFQFSPSKLVLTSKISIPYQLENVDTEHLTEFVQSYAPMGKEYKLFTIDEKSRVATFFQMANKQTIFYNESAYIKVKWDGNKQVTNYEQTAFKNLKSFGEESTLVTPNQAVKTLFKKGYLPEYSRVTKAELGYSTLVPLTETRVLSPTWRIHVEVPKNDKMVSEDMFINAVDGQYIDVSENKEALEAK